AMFNYLALLGWSPGEQEIVSREEIVERFDLLHVQHHPAAFDVQKLEWMNGKYIAQLANDDVASRLEPFLRDVGFQPDEGVVLAAAPYVKERMKTLREGVSLLRFLFEEVEPNDKAQKEI